MKQFPFKFLHAYEKEDKEIFFGREQEVEALYQMVFQTNLLLVYGASGTGKTSLIRCGLANKFKPSQWLDLYIRKGEHICESLRITVENRIPQQQSVLATETDDWFESLIDETEENQERNSDLPTFESDNPTIQALFELYWATFTPIYLIFDQFEELYTLGKPEEQKEFITLIQELVQVPIPLKIIIAMREEYLAKLYDLEKAIPQLRNKKLRLERMDLPKVQQVILNATVNNPRSNVELEQGQQDEIVKLILDNIREGDVNIQLPYLQIYMDRLYVKATGSKTDRTQEAIFTLDHVRQIGDIQRVLKYFLNSQTKEIYKQLRTHFKLSYGELVPEIGWQLLAPFTTLEGTKRPLKESQITQAYESLALPKSVKREEFISKAISEMENSRFLRYRKDDDTYELFHDTWALQVAARRNEEDKAYLKAKRKIIERVAEDPGIRAFFTSKELNYIAEFEKRFAHGKDEDIKQDHLDFIKDSRKDVAKRYRKRRNRYIAAVLVMVGLILYGNFWLRNRENNAREREQFREYVQMTRLIVKAQNCPPQDMQAELLQLQKKHARNDSIQSLFNEYQRLTQHCNPS